LQNENRMPERLHQGGPLTPDEREAFGSDLVSFCERELDLLGDIEGLAVLYAGGLSPLWLEGLSQRIGHRGTLAALDADARGVEEGLKLLEEADLDAPVQLFTGDVLRPPFALGAFDLVYSAGLFHELDVRERSAGDALAALASTVRNGGRIATSDFVDTVPAVQLEDELLLRELMREVSGAELYGVGPPARLVALHEALLAEVRWQLSPPYLIQHLDKIVLAEGEREELRGLPSRSRLKLRGHRKVLRERTKREGYTRPATLYVEGLVAR
jgi:hypothetical protein